MCLKQKICGNIIFDHTTLSTGKQNSNFISEQKPCIDFKELF